MGGTHRTGTFERRVVDCPVCGGDLIEPRSSETWACVQCARQFTPEELTERGIDPPE